MTKVVFRLAIMAAVAVFSTALRPEPVVAQFGSEAAVTAFATATHPEPVVAHLSSEECNHCGPDESCDPFHWDNCGFGGPGFDWAGECTPGCDEQDCANHDECIDFGDLAALDLDATVELVNGRDWMALAKAAMTGRVRFDEARETLLIHSCSGDLVLGQVPLEGTASALLASSIDDRRNALLTALAPEQ